MNVRSVGLWLVAAVVLWTWPAIAQEPILTFSVEPSTVVLTQEGTAAMEIEIRNDSIREADDIEIAWIGTESVSLAEPFETIKVLAPFSSTRASLMLEASADADLGETPGTLDVVYTYCIGDLCFQVVDAVDLQVRVEAAAAVTPPETNGTPVEPVTTDPPPVRPSGGRFPWVWILSALVVLCVGGALWLWLRRGDMRPVYLALLVVAAAGLALGVAQRQHEQAQSIGSVLCLSCVGIEVASNEEPSYRPATIERLEAIDEPVELWVFFAVWCKTCPFAEAMVELAASYNPEQITYRFVDVEREPALAVEHGVVDTGRTVVPAILRVDTGEVIFGTERLEARLVTLLEGAE